MVYHAILFNDPPVAGHQVSKLSLVESPEAHILLHMCVTPVRLLLRERFLEGRFPGQNLCTCLRLLIPFDKLPSREIVPIYTPTGRDWHPGPPRVVNERKLKGEKAGGEKEKRNREGPAVGGGVLSGTTEVWVALRVPASGAREELREPRLPAHRRLHQIKS